MSTLLLDHSQVEIPIIWNLFLWKYKILTNCGSLKFGNRIVVREITMHVEHKTVTALNTTKGWYANIRANLKIRKQI